MWAKASTSWEKVIRKAHSRSFVRRLIDDQGLQVECRKVSDRSVRAIHGRGSGYHKRVLGWLRYAVREGFDALVLVIDHDGDDDRLRQFDTAQDDVRLTELPRALGVAIRTFDAWMLADEAALTVVLGNPIDRQPDPERIKDPKQRCAELRDASDCGLGMAAMYAAIATQADHEVMEVRCPRGFVSFAKRTRRLKTAQAPSEQRRI